MLLFFIVSELNCRLQFYIFACDILIKLWFNFAYVRGTYLPLAKIFNVMFEYFQ